MELVVLKNNNLAVAPITVAEAILVKHKNQQQSLDVVLNSKIDSLIEDSGLQIIDTSIGHSNVIEAQTEFKPLLVKYDTHGHITESTSAGVLQINTTNIYDGSLNVNINLSDDFEMNNNTINLTWGNGNT